MWEKFITWLTGHNPNEKIVADGTKVQATLDALQDINDTKIPASSENVSLALQQLIQTKGFEDYISSVISINKDSLEPSFEEIKAKITKFRTDMSTTQQKIADYSNHPWKRVLATLTMAACKVGEGLLSCVEEVGDGVLSVVGFACPIQGVKDWCKKAVSVQWSHEVFDWAYYSRDLANYSYFTEESALAGGFKIAGKVVGYLYAGGVVSGAAKSIAGASNIGKVGTVAVKAMSGMRRLASTTTWANTAVALFSGFGSGTEEALLNDSSLSIGEAFKNKGLGRGALNAVLAFVGGKVGEASNKYSQIKNAKNAGDTAEVSRLKGLKLRDFEAYTDKITQAGERAGGASQTFARNTRQLLSFNKATRASARANWTSSGKDLLKNNVLVDVAKGSATVVKGAANVVFHPINTVKTVASKTLSVVNPKNIPKNVKTVVSLATNPIAYTAARAVINDPDAIDPNSLFNDLSNTTQPASVPISSPSSSGTSGNGNGTPGNGNGNSGNGNGNSGNGNGTSGNGNGNSGNGNGTSGSGIIADDGSSQSATETTGARTIEQTEVTVPPTTQPTTVSTGARTIEQEEKTVPPTKAASESTGVKIIEKEQTSTPATYTTLPASSVTPTVSPVVSYESPAPVDYSTHSGTEFEEADLEDNLLTTSLGELMDDTTDSIDEIIKGGNFDDISVDRIPTPAEPILANKNNNKGKSSVIPIAAGLSVAAAAGIGAKAYMDHKKNNATGEEEEYSDDYAEDDELVADGWSEDIEPDAMEFEDEDQVQIQDPESEQEFINQDKQGEDEYYHASENPIPITGSDEYYHASDNPIPTTDSDEYGEALELDEAY